MKLGMVFSGYGSQFVGMGKELYDQHRVVQEIFEEASSCLDINFVKLCFASSDVEIKKIDHAFLSIFVTSIAVAAVLKEQGITPSVVAGYDVGEYAAVCAIDGMSRPDALYMIKKYAGLYEAFLTEKEYGMVRVTGLALSDAKALTVQATGGDQRVDIAVFEGPESFVLSGTKEALAEVVETVKKRSGLKITALDVEAGLHSPLMDEIVKNVKMYLEKVDFKDTQVPFVTGVIGEPLHSGEMIRAAIMQHIHAPTQWEKVMEALHDCDVIIEVGPGEYLQGLLKDLYPKKKIYRVLTPADIEQIKADIA